MTLMLSDCDFTWESGQFLGEEKSKAKRGDSRSSDPIPHSGNVCSKLFRFGAKKERGTRVKDRPKKGTSTNKNNKSFICITMTNYCKTFWNIMYQSNRSFNMPPPGNPVGIWLFWKLLFKFTPTRAKMPFKCPTLGSIQVIKCPHPGDISQAQKWQKDGGNAFSCRTKSL